MELANLPVIDTHTHFFDIEYKERDFSEVFSLSLENPPQDQRRHTLLFRWFINELAVFLGCNPEEQKIKNARAERIKQDYKTYLSDLFSDVNLKGLVLDIGYMPADVNLEAFHELVPLEVKYLYRIETIVDKIWLEKPIFNKALEYFDSTLQEFLSKKYFIGLKSIIGYRTGLAVEKVNEQEASTAYQKRYEKAVRDFFLLRALELCRKKGIPMQIHTAFGESNNNLLINNPLLLKPILQDEEIKEQPIVLVHGGYPYTFETGYLCAMYPNVYCDVSEFVPFVPLGMSKGIADIMDMCPLNKIMYGSDAFMIPEFNWFGAKVFKRKLKDLLMDITDQGILDHEYAFDVAEMMTYKNAANFYGFSL